MMAILLALSLAACSPPQKREDLCRYLPQGAEAQSLQAIGDSDEVSSLHAQRDRIAAGLTGDEAPNYCDYGFVLPARSDTAALTAQISAMLGDAWQTVPVSAQEGGQNHPDIYYWRTHSAFWPRQHFILLISPHPQQAGSQYAQTLYRQDSNQRLHSYVVYGTALAPFILLLALGIYVRKRLHKRRALQQRNSSNQR